MSKSVAAVALLLAATTLSVHADPQATACHNKTVNAKWRQLARSHSDSDVWQQLFALRVGLCLMVEKNRMKTDRANRIFKRAQNSSQDALERERRRRQTLSGTSTTALQY